MKFHTNVKKQLEMQLNETNNDDSKFDITKKIVNQDKIIDAWQNNIETINKQLKKI